MQLQQIKSIIKLAYKRILGFISSPLPYGMEQFDNFCTDLFYTYGLPDNPSYRHAIATQIMHLGPTTNRKPKRYFAKTTLKSMANQIAYLKIQEMKKLEQEFIEATMTKQPEVTNANAGSTSGEPIQDQPV